MKRLVFLSLFAVTVTAKFATATTCNECDRIIERAEQAQKEVMKIVRKQVFQANTRKQENERLKEELRQCRRQPSSR